MIVICGQEEREGGWEHYGPNGQTIVTLPWNREIAKAHCEFMDRMGIPKGFECNHNELETTK